MKKFSLILATYGRYYELEKFFQSILVQEYDLDKIEVIVLDQNDKIDITPLIEQFKKQINIRHIRSKKKGLSYNRNLGLLHVSGEIVAFPDDDCMYYPDTLTKVDDFFSRNQADLVLGRIFDRKTNSNVIRNWKNEEFKITIKNFFLNYASITIFTQKNNIKFDERLGVGTKFGSYEDADYIVSALKNNKTIIYNPQIEVWHPQLNCYNMGSDKIYLYGLGFGGLCRKHISFWFVWLFILACSFHLSKMCLACLVFNWQEAKKRYLSVISRVKGFIIW